MNLKNIKGGCFKALLQIKLHQFCLAMDSKYLFAQGKKSKELRKILCLPLHVIFNKNSELVASFQSFFLVLNYLKINLYFGVSTILLLLYSLKRNPYTLPILQNCRKNSLNSVILIVEMLNNFTLN